VCPKWGYIILACHAHFEKAIPWHDLFEQVMCLRVLHLSHRLLYKHVSFEVWTNVCDIGSMTTVPRDMLQEIKRLEELFIVPTEKLKEITTHFVSELIKGKCIICVKLIKSNIKLGLSVEGGSIVRTTDFFSALSAGTITDSNL
jgi:hypothetical protein